MFEVALEFLKDFANIIPALTCVILVINLCCSMLWGDN